MTKPISQTTTPDTPVVKVGDVDQPLEPISPAPSSSNVGRHIFDTGKVYLGFYLNCFGQLFVFSMYNIVANIASTIHGTKAVVAMSIVYAVYIAASLAAPTLLAAAHGRASLVIAICSCAYIVFAAMNIYGRIYTLCIGGAVVGCGGPIWSINNVSNSKLSLYCAERQLLHGIQHGEYCNEISDEHDPPNHCIRQVTDPKNEDQIDWYLSTIIDKNNRLMLEKISHQQLNTFKTLSAAQIGAFTTISWLFMQASGIVGSLIAFGCLHIRIGNDLDGLYDSDTGSVRIMYGILTFICALGSLCYFFSFRVIPKRVFFATNLLSKWDLHLREQMLQYKPDWPKSFSMDSCCLVSLQYTIDDAHTIAGTVIPSEHDQMINRDGSNKIVNSSVQLHPNNSQSESTSPDGISHLPTIFSAPSSPAVSHAQSDNVTFHLHGGDQLANPTTLTATHSTTNTPNQSPNDPAVNNITHLDDIDHGSSSSIASGKSGGSMDGLSLDVTSPVIVASEQPDQHINNPHQINQQKQEGVVAHAPTAVQSPMSPHQHSKHNHIHARSPMSPVSPMSPINAIASISQCNSCNSFCGENCHIVNPHSPNSPLYLHSRDKFPGPALNDPTDDNGEFESPPIKTILRTTLWYTWKTFQEPAILLLCIPFLTLYTPFSFTVSAYSSKGGVKDIIGVKFVPLFICLVATADLVGAFILKQFLKTQLIARIAAILGLGIQLVAVVLMYVFPYTEWTNGTRDAWKFISIIGILMGLGDAMSVSGCSTLLSCMTRSRSELLAAGSSLLMTGRGLGLCLMFILTATSNSDTFRTRFWPIMVALICTSILCHIISLILNPKINVERVMEEGKYSKTTETTTTTTDVELATTQQQQQQQQQDPSGAAAVAPSLQPAALSTATSDVVTRHKHRRRHRHNHHHHHHLNHHPQIHTIHAFAAVHN